MNRLKEKTFYEGGPAKADLILNILAGFTLIGLPFTFGAIVRALWLRFKITNKRVSVIGGWLGRDQTQVVYSQVTEVLSIPRGLGSYGDMVLIVKGGTRVEMRSVPNFRETKEFILDQMRSSNSTSKDSNESVQGFAA